MTNQTNERIRLANFLVQQYPDRNIPPIKEYRRVTGAGLKEAKNMIDAARAGELVERPEVETITVDQIIVNIIKGVAADNEDAILNTLCRVTGMKYTDAELAFGRVVLNLSSGLPPEPILWSAE